jgi:glutamate/tyrosine decarboxylase-like PLP-dependent enzyme
MTSGGCAPAVVATVGATATTAIDPVGAIADVARRHGLWLHVDAAMTGSAMILPECIRHEPFGLSEEELDHHTQKWQRRSIVQVKFILPPAKIDGHWMVRVSVGALPTEATTWKLHGPLSAAWPKNR